MLKLIYGKSGTGKSSYLYERIKENIANEKIYLIVPEQSNLKAEQKLFEVLDRKASFHVQVLTLSRIATRILEEVGGNDFVAIDQSSKNMIIYDILAKERENLSFLGKSDKNIEIVSNMITEFKKHEVTTELLEKITIKNELTKRKIEDMKLIYQKYQERLQGNFIDENDILTMISSKISQSELFQSARIYIDDFLGFTPQEYHVFENILKVAEEVTVAICADNFLLGEKESDIFYFNKIFANHLIEIANKNEIKVEKIILEENRKTQSEDLRFLENAFRSSASLEMYSGNPQDIKMFLAKNSYSELEYVANEILRLVKENHYQYKEIAIVSNELETYDLEAKVIFEKYQIPIFIDNKKDLNQNLLIQYVLAILEIFAQNWSFESVFNYVKLGLLQDISEEDIYLLENYCRRWGIQKYKWLKPFAIEEKNDIQDKLENIRKQIIEPLAQLKENMSALKNAEEMTKQLYDFVIENHIDAILNKKLNEINKIEISNEYNTSYKIFVSVLESIVAIFGKEKINFEEYKNLIQVGFGGSKLGTIPATQDQVILGDCKRSKNNDIKVCFIVGINDGIFPKVNKFEGFLNDDDRECLKEAGMELANTSLEAMYENNFEIYHTFTLASSKVYLSYCSQDKEGKSLRPSILIKKIKKLFPKIEEESDIIDKKYYITNKTATFDDSIAVYREFLNGKELEEEWKAVLSYYHQVEKDHFQKIFDAENYDNCAETISKKNLEKLYGKKWKGSVSKLEQYRNCPFAFHLKYGLKLKEKEEFKIQALETGTFMHEIIDTFFSEIEKNKIKLRELEDKQLERIVNKIIEDLLLTSKYYIFSSTSKFKVLTRKLKKVTLESIQYIVYTLRNSDFELLGHEIEFKPIIIDLEDGKKVQIEGKIDRLDIGKIDEKTYVRIIDYKSRIKTLDRNKLEAGLQIQLVTYLDAVCKQENFEPAGVLYSSLIDGKLKWKSGKMEINEEEIEDEIRKKFRMQGIVLADMNIVKMMDHKLNAGETSDMIPVSLKKDGEFDTRSSKILKKEEFENLQKKINQIIKEISTEILSGKIGIEPYSYKEETGCTYCQYGSICRFNPNFKNNTYHYIEKGGE